MRVFLLLLVLANLAFFAWSRNWVPTSGDADLIHQQFNRDGIRLLAADSTGVARESVAATKNGVPVSIGGAACLQVGAFNVVDAAKVEAEILGAAPGGRLVQRRIDETARWWVYMPPQGAREGALKKVAELKRLGVEEMFILQDDPKFPFAVSLGVFRSEEAARNRLEQLRVQGVRTAQVGERPTAVQRVVYELRNVDESAAVKLRALKEVYPGADVKACSEGQAKASKVDR